MKHLLICVSGFALLWCTDYATAEITISLDKTSYDPTEDIVVSWTDGPGNPADWIGIYPRGLTPGLGSSGYLYVNGTQVSTVGVVDGSVTFTPSFLPGPGSWTAWYLLDDGYTSATEGVDFDIGIDGLVDSFSLDKTSYEFSEDIVVSWTNGPGNPADWIGIYPRGLMPGVGSSGYLYVNGTQVSTVGVVDGSVTFTPSFLPGPGSWTAWYLLDEGYTPATEGVDFDIGINIDDDFGSFSLDKASYGSSEDIVVSWTDGPENATDWIGVYPRGVTPSSGSSAWLYVNGTQSATAGVVDGSVTFSPFSLPGPGDWTAWYLLNDVYTPATGGVDFTIINDFASITSFTSSSQFIGDDPITLSWSVDDLNGNIPIQSLTIEDGINPSIDVKALTSLDVNPSGNTDYTLSLNDGADTRLLTVYKDTGSNATFSLDWTTYTPEEDVVATWADAAGGPTDWIGIYKLGDTPGSISSTLWNYLDGTQVGGGFTPSGSMTFPPLPEGDYFAVLLLNDVYTIAQGPIRFKVSLGGRIRLKITEISYDQATELITITWTSRPNKTYAVFFSDDEQLNFNADVDDSVVSAGDTTTLTFSNPEPGALKLFFRVLENGL